MTHYKISLHSHISDFAHFIFTKPDNKKYVINLLNKLVKKHGNLVLGITNFDNNECYNNLLKYAQDTYDKSLINSKYQDYFFYLKINNRRIYFIKTDEIETDKGHILIIGFKGKIKGVNLKYVLKEAHRQHCIIIANHPLHKFGVSYFLIKKILGGQNRISLTKDNIKNYQKYFNALELNSYFPEDWKEVRKFAKKIKEPVVSESDSHFLNEIFTSWYETDNLNFESPTSFKKSLKMALINGVELHAHKYGYLALYKHAFQVAIESILQKIGLIKR